LRIDRSSDGDPARHLTFDALVAALAAVRSPATDGRVSLVVRRAGPDHEREVLDRVTLTPGRGVPGDAWEERVPPVPDAQLATIQTPVAELIANGQPLPLTGDNLFFDLDLSKENLPIGSRVRVGQALLEVTPKAHNGCKKFRARFGEEALRFVSDAALRHRNLRGIYFGVVEGGLVAVGDAVVVVQRP
jgi:MOSC domain-containing protein YiiM